MNNLLMQPRVRVGLCENSRFGLLPEGEYDVQASEDSIVYTPLTPASRMTVKGLVIGRKFHWQQQRDLVYKGSFIFRRTPDGSSLINLIPVEEYIESVISSEMSAKAPPEYLKAHAIISRSWLMRILTGKHPHKTQQPSHNEAEYISFTQNDLHSHFDVCCDDHCQRYQGISEINERAAEAVKSTFGQVLADGKGEIADCRFSKCCGGMTEQFSTAWQDCDFPYLPSKADPFCDPSILTEQEQTELRLCMKDYDSATSYYRWMEPVSSELIRANMRRETGMDLGDITELRAIERGGSGRIKLLEITGTKNRMRIGKELVIRRMLSDSHLKSSAFDIEKRPGGFLLNGRGWGHGVGFCQTGAAVMALKGMSAEKILQFYYPHTHISKIYE